MDLPTFVEGIGGPIASAWGSAMPGARERSRELLTKALNQAYREGCYDGRTSLRPANPEPQRARRVREP